MEIYISGLYSGPNPSPGVGIARSLRSAYPDIKLVGVDYSNRSTGLHWHEFDDIWLQRPWNELDLEEYRSQIERILESNALWISGLDLEIVWLADFHAAIPNLLIPPQSAVRSVAKPAVSAASHLPMRIPKFMSTANSDWDMYAFCRTLGWQVWIKGPYYEAQRVTSWNEFSAARFHLSRTWSTEELFLQEHVDGYEEALAFCAFNGEILDCVWMSKREITPEGKTWAGHTSDVPDSVLGPLREIVREINWTGGAELELIRDFAGDLWLMEWNPRFPAWIYGATLSGHNLPGKLVQRAAGIESVETSVQSHDFVRVVLEIPVRSKFPLPALPEPEVGLIGMSRKHPSGMPMLAGRLHSVRNETTRVERSPNTPRPLKESMLRDLEEYDLAELVTPEWLFLESTAQDTFKQAGELSNSLSSPNSAVMIAYSMKTNPDNRFLRLSADNGLFVEVISQLEMLKAVESGFSTRQIVLNGPGKWWPLVSSERDPLFAIFCDSLEELRTTILWAEGTDSLANYVGIRLRPPQPYSRFGVPVGSYDSFRELVKLVKALPVDFPLGVHFHIASSLVGTKYWFNVLKAVLEWCDALQCATGKRIRCFDAGGGWWPDDWDAKNGTNRVEDVVLSVRKYLPDVHHIILEPGKALSQTCMVLATRVLEVRSMGGSREIVVDGSIAELPEINNFPHRLLAFTLDKRDPELLKRGSDRIVGRLCMEGDVLFSGVRLPDGIAQDDVLLMCDVGAYDRSMSYAFGRG